MSRPRAETASILLRLDDPEHEAQVKLAAIAALISARATQWPRCRRQDRRFVSVVGVSTGESVRQGQRFVGISQAAPIYQALEGKMAGETCEFRNRKFLILRNLPRGIAGSMSAFRKDGRPAFRPIRW